MLFSIALGLTWGVTRILAVSITASDLPECAIECYVNTGAKVEIPITDYEGQCRSGEFQVELRQCAENICSPDEYSFTEFHAKEYCSEFGVDIDHVLKQYKETVTQEQQTEEVPGDASFDDGSTDETVGTSTCSLCTGSMTATGLVASTATATTTDAGTGVNATASAAAESASASASAGTSEGSSTTLRMWFPLVVGMIVGVVCIV